jgi:hypothetical protein
VASSDNLIAILLLKYPAIRNYLMKSSKQIYWGFGLFPSSGILGSRNTTFRKLDLFSSSSETGEKTPTQLGPLGVLISTTGRVDFQISYYAGFCEFSIGNHLDFVFVLGPEIYI